MPEEPELLVLSDPGYSHPLSRSCKAVIKIDKLRTSACDVLGSRSGSRPLDVNSLVTSSKNTRRRIQSGLGLRMEGRDMLYTMTELFCARAFQLITAKHN